MPWRSILGTLLGAVAGYAYFRVAGCRSGICIMTSTAYLSVLIGAVMGLVIAGPPDGS